MKRSALPATLLVLLLVAACGSGDGPSWPPSKAAVAAMNVGLGHLEKFDYTLAIQSFEEAVKLSPKWVDARVNLAIAYLNTRGKGDHDKAVRLCREILVATPDHPHANFILGFILRLRGFAEEALPNLRKVVEIDPADASAWAHLGKAWTSLGENEKALEAFDRAIAIDPHLSTAYFQRAARLGRAGRMEEATATRKEWSRLQPGQGGEPYQANLITEKAYQEIGKYAMAIRNYAGVEREPIAPSTVSFAERSVGGLADWKYGGEAGPEFVPVEGAEIVALASRIGPGVVLGDIDADGDTDLFLPQWGGAGRLYRNDGAWKFTDVTSASGIATKTDGIAGCFFDADGDGDMDLYVTAAGPNVFYENEGEGVFADRTKERGLAGPTRSVSLAAVPGDFDHEGDIDLYVANYESVTPSKMAGEKDSLFRNNRDGTFTDVAGESDAHGGAERTIGALPIDIDGDLDTDLLVLRDRGPALLLINQRFMEFTVGKVPPELAGAEPAWGATAADIDLDGRNEVLIFRGPGADASLFRTTDTGGLEFIGNGLSRLRWRTGVFLDVDLDGYLDLIGDDFVRLGGDGAPVTEAVGPAVPKDSRGIGFADFDGDGDLDRIAATQAGVRVIETKAPADHHWLALKLTGKRNLMPAAWTAKTGPGQEVEVRSGKLWQPLRARVTTGFLSSIEPVARFGLGKHDVAELVRILWPDRVLQVEVEIPTDQVAEIVQMNRKPTSCPLLFAWDGRDFVFVTDFLGVGGLGFLAEPGVYGASDPDEYVYIGDWVKPVDGEYVLQLMEPLEEITYLDEAALLVVDHPAGMEVRPNERFIGFPELFPKARIFGIEDRIAPKRATSIDGKDITKIVADADRRYAPITPDGRFLGFAKEHAVTLDFAVIPSCALTNVTR